MLGNLVLQHTDNLSKALQSSDLSAAEGQELASLCVETLTRIRTEECFDLFWLKVQNIAGRVDIGQAVLLRWRKVIKKLEIGEGERSYFNNVSDYFRIHYFEALDLVISCIKQRFDQPSYGTYKNLQQLLIHAANGKNYDHEFEFVIKFYGKYFEPSSLKVQLETLGTYFISIATRTHHSAIHLSPISRDVKIQGTDVFTDIGIDPAYFSDACNQCHK